MREIPEIKAVCVGDSYERPAGLDELQLVSLILDMVGRDKYKGVNVIASLDFVLTIKRGEEE